ncbi:MAG TPA: cyclic nucleotide-binding domain-containing protein [Myxococcota bacterium]|nr:cyclic nucleotide-binding domain-containing protein [Myxococcota bacterium]HRY92577.1 cyclic nucleotide-binding domain-containing protein [Myxococcota bacterium]
MSAEKKADLTTARPLSGLLPVCAFLEKQVLFKGLKREELDLLFRAGRLLRCAAGEVILREGEPGDVLFLVYSGSVEVWGQGPRGRLELGHLARGAIFGEVGFLLGKPRTASVRAVEPCELVLFGRTELEPLLAANPKLRKLMEAMMRARAQDTIAKALAGKG